MAVDTRLKRGSILGLTLASLVVLPDPDTSVDDADRVSLAYSYAGTDFSGVSGTIANVIDGFSQSATGVVEVGGAITSTIDGFSQSATGVLTNTGTVTSTIDGFSQAATGGVEVQATVASIIDGFSQSATGENGEAAATPRTKGGYIPPGALKRIKNRKPRTPEWEKRDQEKREFEQHLEAVYRQVTGEAPATDAEREVSREVVATVRPYSAGKSRRPPAVSKIDFSALADNIQAANKLLELAEKRQALDEEDAILMVLM